MPACFVDTSALLKLYIAETGSRWMVDEIQSQGISVSALAFTEVGTALSRRFNDGLITAEGALAAWRAFRRQSASFGVVNLGRAALLRAAQLAARSPVPLRALDAIQLQGAFEARSNARAGGLASPLFITADARLEAAAQAHGFTTDNPLNHQ